MLTRTVAAIAAVMMLAACDSADGYRFGTEEFDRPSPNITIVTHPTLADLRAKAPASAKVEGLAAWSIIRPASCEVHVVDPKVSWQPEWIGHEVAHCVWGRWHA